MTTKKNHLQMVSPIPQIFDEYDFSILSPFYPMSDYPKSNVYTRNTILYYYTKYTHLHIPAII